MTEIIEQHGLGWLPDLPDYRDWILPTAAAPPTLPSSVSLRPQTVQIEDQLSLGSCTANSTGSMFAFVDKKQDGLNIKPSRLQIYYDARAIDGLQTADHGAYIRSALKALADTGTADESLWPYLPAKVNEKPPQGVYNAATEHQATSYMRVNQTESAMKACLADGYPFVLGFSMYENFTQASQNGAVPMPSGKSVGGHAVMAIGYDDRVRRWEIQNSWGQWGDHGYLWMPYDYLTDEKMASDLWTIRRTEESTIQPEPEPPDPNHYLFIATVLVAKPGKLVLDTDRALPNLKGRSVRGVTRDAVVLSFTGRVKNNDEDVMTVKGSFDVALKGASVQVETV